MDSGMKARWLQVFFEEGGCCLSGRRTDWADEKSWRWPRTVSAWMIMINFALTEKNLTYWWVWSRLICRQCGKSLPVQMTIHLFAVAEATNKQLYLVYDVLWFFCRDDKNGAYAQAYGSHRSYGKPRCPWSPERRHCARKQCQRDKSSLTVFFHQGGCGGCFSNERRKLPHKTTNVNSWSNPNLKSRGWYRKMLPAT